ncbi:MAG: ABC transporter ATP-binding protein, partial [Rhizobium oryzihabitans]
MANISIRNVSKSYGALNVLRPFSLEIENGEFVVLVGPSGCGKSTMLKILAGLEPASEGQIFIGDREVTDLAPGDRDIAMVFQNYALYPHLTVRQNIGFGLKMRGTDRQEIDRRVDDAARILEVTPYLDRKPKDLSGGQRQRVALGRAIVRQPQAFLMDEPLSNLDAKLRVHMRAEIGALHKRIGVTTVYVTHDQVEAMTMADRVVIMQGGIIQQIAAPDELFNNPANLFVAGFIGSPGMNFLNTDIRDGTLTLFGQKVSLPGA